MGLNFCKKHCIWLSLLCQTNSCLYQSPMTHLSIYILHTLSTYMMYLLLYNYLPFTCTSLKILHKTYLNTHDNTFVSSLSLIFTRQSHIILSGYDSQETLFYLKAELTFIEKSTDLRDPLYSHQSARQSIEPFSSCYMPSSVTYMPPQIAAISTIAIAIISINQPYQVLSHHHQRNKRLLLSYCQYHNNKCNCSQQFATCNNKCNCSQKLVLQFLQNNQLYITCEYLPESF